MAGSTAPSSGGHGGHAAGFDPHVMFAQRTKNNQHQMIAYIASMIMLAMFFISFQWLRRVVKASATPTSSSPSFLIVAGRKLRSFLIRDMKFLPSFGHGSLVTLYVAINVCLTFTKTDPKLTMVSNLSSRTGWMAIANLVVVIFLALKNTPLAVLSAWSYERLNILHQVSGNVTVIYVILHASLYSYNFISANNAVRLLERDEIFGMVAGLSFVIIGISGVLVRRWWYEMFYYIHVTFWILGLAMTGLHQPELSKKVVYVVGVVAGIWVLDRIIRLVRLAIYSTSNTVIVTPLSNGATRVTLKKPPVGAVSGKHCFLWIPKIRRTETHPFTIASMDPVEFVISSYDGFTRDLHAYAQANPGAELTASVEGAYGTFPDTKRFKKVIMVAGGTGATFTFGAALNTLKRLGPEDHMEVVFIWIVRYKAYLTWFADHINTLQADNRFKIKLYVTQAGPEMELVAAQPSAPASAPASSSTLSTAAAESKAATTVPEKAAPRPGTTPTQPTRHVSFRSAYSKGSMSDEDLASPIEGIDSSVHNVPITFERPKVAQMVRDAIERTPRTDNVLVMGCGPKGLMKVVRNTTADCIKADGPSVELHCEQFGW